MLNRLVIFLGSALGFCVEPLVGRTLLPHFGGSAATWLSCLSTFQVLLLAGYGYAQWAGASTRPARLRVHAVLLAGAACAIGAVAVVGGRVAAFFSGLTGIPALNVVLAVLALAGAAFVLLAANATLLQTLAGGDYRLYAVSNLGSFAGLFAYPLLIEPWVPVGWQWAGLAAGVMTYAVLFGVCARRYGEASSSRCAVEPDGADADAAENAGWQTKAFVYPLVSTYVLNAVTAHLTVDIAPLPMVWSLLLGLYLLTWVVGFWSRGERLKWVWTALAALSVLGCLLLHDANETTSRQLAREFACSCALLLFSGLALHSHLCAARPDAALLPRYNFLIAAGGAAGGILSGIVSPLVFDSLLEYPVALGAVAVFFGERLWWARPRHVSSERILIALVLVGVLCGHGILNMVRDDRAGDLARGRSFYGPWRVYRRDVPTASGDRKYAVNFFKHGGTAHGFEPAEDVDRCGTTGYYVPENGGLAFSLHRGWAAKRPIRAGLVGLGIGTMAWYGHAGDFFRFYEICPQVADVAVNGPWFDFMRNCRARCEVRIGDARRSLEAERARHEEPWDVLVVDAYSGDSVPIHLLTREAFRLYLDRLADDGILALHISNWHVDLVPAAKAVGKEFNLDCRIVQADGGTFSLGATWAFLSRKRIELPPETPVINPDDVRDMGLPTDARGSLLGFIRF